MHPLLNVIIYPDRMDWGLYNEAVEGLKKLEGRPNNSRIKAEALYYKEMMRRAGADVSSDSELFLEERTWYLADVLREYDKVMSRCDDEYKGHNPFDKFDKRYKGECTRMDVNNMLFTLHADGLLHSYSCVASPFDLPSYNERLFSDDEPITVRLR